MGVVSDAEGSGDAVSRGGAGTAGDLAEDSSVGGYSAYDGMSIWLWVPW